VLRDHKIVLFLQLPPLGVDDRLGFFLQTFPLFGDLRLVGTFEFLFDGLEGL
jgi:hypothetical protein